MLESLTFVVPLPENLANARMHWRTKERFRSAYFDSLDLLYAARLLPRVPESGAWESATIRAEMVMPRDMDDDNAIARCKWPVDWIVRKGFVADDSRKHLRWESLPDQTITSVKVTPSVIRLTLTRSDSETLPHTA